MNEANAGNGVLPSGSWEYAVGVLTGDLVAALNNEEIGGAGWEVVQLIPQANETVHALMKRPKRLIALPTETEVRRLTLISGD